MAHRRMLAGLRFRPGDSFAVSFRQMNRKALSTDGDAPVASVYQRQTTMQVMLLADTPALEFPKIARHFVTIR